MRVILDTNVLISALAFPAGKPDQILERVRRRDLQLVISPFILEETERVLVHKFGLLPGAAAGLIRDLEDLAEVVHPTERLRLVTAKDDDDRILECAVAGQADVLVTGDKRHLLPLGSIGGPASSVLPISLPHSTRLHEDQRTTRVIRGIPLSIAQHASCSNGSTARASARRTPARGLTGSGLGGLAQTQNPQRPEPVS